MRCAASALLAATITGTAAADLVIDRSGFGGVVRFGGIVPLRIEASLPAGDVREGVDAEFVVEVANVDGDIAEYSTRTVLSSGATSIWVYPWIAEAVSGKPLALASYEREDGRRGRLIERIEVKVEQPSRGAVVAPPSCDIIGVVGAGNCGLSAWDPGQQSPCINGSVVIAERMNATELPDRVEGWSGFKAVVWAGTPIGALLPAQDSALREWVEGGGRLVLQVSAAADGFSLDSASSGWMKDALEGLTWQKVEDVKASTLLPVISSQRLDLRKDGVQPLTTLTGCTGAWVELVSMPLPRAWNGVPEPKAGTLDGACIVAERPWGTGSIVVSGLDADALQRRRFANSDLPETGIWWNRIMGRRGDTPPIARLREWIADKPSPIEVVHRRSDLGDGQFFDAYIGMRSTAANLTSISILIFAAYWLLAGPISFYLLRYRKLERLSWIAFVAIACAFGAVSWLAGAALRQANARAQHLTVLDAVVMPGAATGSAPAVSARIWASAFLPDYGRSEVSLPAGKGVLRPFAPAGDQGEFPDSSRFTVQASRPGTLELPARATATMVSGTWTGDLTTSWRGLPAVSGGPIQQTATWTRNADAGPASLLTGRLKHGLQAPLTDVLILHVTPFRPAPPRFNDRAIATTKAVPVAPSDAMPSMVLAHGRSVWAPGEELELAVCLYGSSDAKPSALAVIDPANPGMLGLGPLLEDLVAPSRNMLSGLPGGGAMGDDQAREELTMMSLYGMLPSPLWWAASAQARGPTASEVRIGRGACHDIDLSHWCSRPCVIVMGFLRIEPEDASIDGGPVPLSIDGDPTPMSGTTLVRVVFPLPQVDALVPATLVR